MPRRKRLVLEQVLEGHADRVWHLAWSPTGDTLASCSSDKTVRIWCPAGAAPDAAGAAAASSAPPAPRFACAATLEDSHTKTVRCSAWSPDASRLLTVSFDARASMWRRTLPPPSSGGPPAAAAAAAAAAARATWRRCWESGACHESEVKGADWSPCGGFAATCGRDRHVWVWELLPNGGGGGEADAMDEEEDDDGAGGAAGNGAPAAPGGGGALEAVDVKSGHSGDVKAVAWHPKGDGVFATASYDDTVRVWAAEGGLGAAASGAVGGGEWECEQVLEARGAADGAATVELEVWGDDGEDDDEDDEEKREGGGGANGASAAAANGRSPPPPPKKTVPFADRGGHTCTVWDVRFSRHDGGARMATASADGTVRVWSAAFEPGSAGRRPAFAAEAVVLAGYRRRRRGRGRGRGAQGEEEEEEERGAGAVEEDGDDEDEDEEDAFAEVLSVDWSARGLLATGDAGNALRVFEPVAADPADPAAAAPPPPRWRLAASAPPGKHQHPRDVNCVRWHPTDASLVATACDDGAVRLWRLVEEDEEGG
jgi:WD40 repeat protein